ncbi:hypothetical protein NE237_023954 [Protea cynaroides]|uniref:Uncharacterized protein n=1 Tax=Protea cynaroides TaxID=273540 RepID=A0A9Q0HG23_9MAGN|nr:hypothetical protein NE237_023954 [Protea cynaroides]
MLHAEPMVKDSSDADGSVATEGQDDCVQGRRKWIFDNETKQSILDRNLLFADTQEYEQGSGIVMESGLADRVESPSVVVHPNSTVMVRGAPSCAVGYSEASGYLEVVGAIFFNRMPVAGDFRLLGVGSGIALMGRGYKGNPVPMNAFIMRWFQELRVGIIFQGVF